MALSKKARALLCDNAEAMMDTEGGKAARDFDFARVEEDRAIFREIASQLARPSMECFRVENITVPNGDFDVPVRLYWPFEAKSDKAVASIVYCHGGGWCIGDIDTHDSLCREICVRAGMVIANVGYRIAPEHKFPTALEDCAAAIRWLRANAEKIGVDPSRVGISGESAGGNIAAGVAMMAKDDPSIKLAAQFLHYGLYNARKDFTPPSRIDLGSDGTFQPSQAQIHAVLEHYTASEEDRDHPWMSPLLAEDYTGLCPASITTGGFDPLRDDGALYAKRLREHGIHADYRCWVTCIHGYLNWGAQLGDVSEESFAHFIEQAKELLGSSDAAAGMQHVT